MEQLENIMLQEQAEYIIDYEEYEDRMKYEFDREMEE